jgi:hypothetical protein
VLDAPRIAVIAEASGEPGKDPRALLNLRQEQRATIRADRPTIESGHDLASTRPFEPEFLLATLCLHQVVALWVAYPVRRTRVMPQRATA